jgi:hypothetical protein
MLEQIHTTDRIQQQGLKNNRTKKLDLSITPGENLDEEAHSSHRNIPK